MTKLENLGHQDTQSALSFLALVFRSHFQSHLYYTFKFLFQDIFYLFDVTSFPLPMLPTNEAALARRRMVRLWTNFAVFGDPTPITDSLIPTR